MTKSTKILIITVVIVAVVLLTYTMLFSWVAMSLGIPAWLSGLINFVIVFGFLQSPWYTKLTDWIEAKLEAVK